MTAYGFMVLTCIFCVVLFLFSTALFCIACFLLGKCIQSSKQADIKSSVAVLASLHSLTVSEGLSKSTIIQRIIEKYNVVAENKDVSEEMKKLEKDIQDTILGVDRKITPEQELEIKIRNDILKTNALNPKDLV